MVQGCLRACRPARRRSGAGPSRTANVTVRVVGERIAERGRGEVGRPGRLIYDRDAASGGVANRRIVDDRPEVHVEAEAPFVVERSAAVLHDDVVEDRRWIGMRTDPDSGPAARLIRLTSESDGRRRRPHGVERPWLLLPDED